MKIYMKKIKWLAYNIFTIIANLFIRRDKSIWLFGAWMGSKCSDNTRFLFQYLCECDNNKIKEVVWCTRNSAVYEEMKQMGYRVCMSGTKESLYYHLKAGVHVICNMYENVFGYEGDIDGRYSWGAKKVQLWHGVAIKACGALKNGHNQSKNNILHKISNSSILSPGRWNQCYWIATSEENKRVIRLDHGIQDERIIVVGYPRFLKAMKYFENEKNVIEMLNKYKNKGYNIVYYFPTFRDNYDKYKHPIEEKGFVEKIEKNKILWVQKEHYVVKESAKAFTTENIMQLPTEFDINVIMDKADVVVSDYSSVVADALAFGKKVLHYVPDYKDYTSKDRGFVNEFELYNPGLMCYYPEKLIAVIKETLNEEYFTEEIRERYKVTKILLLSEKVYSYEDIYNELEWRMRL